MKKIMQRIILLLLICIPSLILSGCEDVDWDLAALAAEAWAEENGLYRDGKFAPIPMLEKAAENTIRDATHDEPFVQLDGLDVIQDIEQADSLAEEALDDLDADKMATAISIRPNDWRLLEQEGVVWLANANGAAAQSSFTKSDEMMKERLQSGGDCFAMRRAQLETRLFTLSDAITTSKISGKPGVEALQQENRRVADELSRMNTTQQSDFCE